MVRNLVIAGALAVLSAAPAEAKPAKVIGVATVIDGDTIEIHGERIRLFGMDAPEGRQRCETAQGRPWRCGQDAAVALSDRIGRQTVICAPKHDRDRYGRIVATCSVGNLDLGEWLVREGWAVAYRRYSTTYVAAERDARSARRGLWAGRFEMPWDWRHRGRR